MYKTTSDFTCHKNTVQSGELFYINIANDVSFSRIYFYKTLFKFSLHRKSCLADFSKMI